MACISPNIINISVTGDCSNNGSGAYYFEIQGSAPPYTIYTLTPSASTISLPLGTTAYTFTNLTAGTYTFKIKDTCLDPGNLFSDDVGFVISSGCCVSILETQDTTCNSDNGSITATTETSYGTSTFYLYDLNTSELIDTQIANPTNVIFENLSASTYYVIGDDGGGCTGRSESCIVKSSTTLTYDLYSVNNAGCNGTNAGAIYVTNLNGFPPYTYLWSNGETTSYITGLTTGGYYVDVTDSTGCLQQKSVFISDVPSLGLGSIFLITPTCLSSNGEVTVVVTGGTGPYYYQCTNAVSEITYSQTHTFTNLPSGPFTIQVTDAGLCTFSYSSELTPANGFSIVSIETNSSICSFTNGSVSISLYSGTAPYSYTLEDPYGNTLQEVTNSPTWSFVGLTANTYQLTISGGSCSYTTSLTVDNLATIDVSHNYTGTTCNECNGAVELVVSGGTGTYTYGLTNQAPVTLSLSSYTFTDLCPGTYVGSIQNERCTVYEGVLIPSSPTVMFTLQGTNPTPYATDGTLSAYITNGTPPFTLTWSPNVGLQTGLDLVGLSAGTYTLTIQDSDGCTQTKSYTLVGNLVVSDYEIFNVCDSNFTNSGILLTKGPKQMLLEGYYDLTSGDTNCILNEAIFTAIVTVGEETKYETFYTGTNLNDYPSDQEFSSVLESMLFSFDGISGVTIDFVENTIKITTKCGILSDTIVKIDLLISYDISCEQLQAIESPPPI